MSSDLDDLAEIAGDDGEYRPRTRRHRGGLMKTDEGVIHCKRGHELSPDNVRLVHSPGGSVFRNCRKCERLRYLATRERQS